jgi:LysR family transcriptional regulator (chromosome initiation inhibitor)
MSLLSPQLEAFIAVSQTKTVHGAAKEIRISQTGITQRIRTLEKSLSVTLFTRSRRGMLLTHEGEALLRYCMSARELEGPVLAKLQGPGKGALTKVCITGPTSILRSRIIPQSISIMKKYKDLLFNFNITDEETWIEDLRTGVAQIAVVPPHCVSRELESRILKPERYVMMGCKAWKNRSVADVVKTERMMSFNPYDEVPARYLQKFRLLEHVRSDRYFLNSNEGLALLIQNGIGYGVLTLEFAEKFLERCDLVLLNDRKTYDQPMAIAWYPRPEGPEYWRDLISSFR